MDRLLRILFAAFWLTFPCLNVGVSLGDYPLPLPMIVLLLIDVTALCLIVMQGPRRLRGQVTVAALLFLLYAVTMAFWRVELEEYLFSLTALLCLWIPFLVRFPVASLREYSQKWFLRGQYLNWGICLFAPLSWLIGAKPLDQIVPVIVPQRTSPLAGDWLRLNGLMVEPSFLGIYLVFGYIVNDLTVKNPSRRGVSAIVFLILILLTGSMAGIGLWLFYLGVKYLRSVRLSPTGLFVSKSSLYSLLTIFIVLTLMLLGAALTDVGREGLGYLVDYVGYRLDRIGQYLESGDFLSSEGVRLSAIPIALKYLRQGHVIGEGYGLANQWLAAHTWLEDGNIHNIYTYLLVSLGLPGLALFLAFPVLLGRQVDAKHRNMMPAWYFAGFLTGHLIFYYYWGYLLLFTIWEKRQISGDRPEDR